MTKENLERRMILYGIDLNTIPIKEPECNTIISIDEPIPLATIPPTPHRYGRSYYTQPFRTKPLLLEAALPKGSVVALPAGTKILPLKYNEELLEVKTNRKGEVVCAKYSTGEHTYFDGVRTHLSKVKFIHPKEAPKSAMVGSETP